VPLSELLITQFLSLHSLQHGTEAISGVWQFQEKMGRGCQGGHRVKVEVTTARDKK